MMLKKIFNIPNKIKIIFFIIWNRLKFTLKGVSFGTNLIVYNRMYLAISKNANIEIGNNFIFTSGNNINPLCRNIRGCLVASPYSSIKIGNNVGMSSPCIWAHSSITIGNNVKIGGDCIIMDSDAHSLNYIDRRNPTIDDQNKKNSPIVIENDVLLGTRCIILKGVTIGARSIIGSGSLVTKTIPSDCIAAGNPCKIIRYINEK